MRPRMPGFLVHERLDGRSHLRIVDQRFRFGESLDEPAFHYRQQQMENVQKVGGKRIARYPVQRSARPVEARLPALRRISVVVDFETSHELSPASGYPSLPPSSRF